MMNNFAACLAETLKWEGGFADNPHDPGGVTMRGVTARTFEDFTGKPVSRVQMASLTKADVAPIYLAKYWLVAQCDKLPAGVDMSIFDEAVNSGPGRAMMQLRQAVKPDSRDTIIAIANGRLGFLRALRTWRYFGPGWSRRVAGIEAASLAMAGAPLAPIAAHQTVRAATNRRIAHTVVGGSVASGAATQVPAIHAAGGSPMVYVILGIAAVAALAFSGYLYWRSMCASARARAIISVGVSPIKSGG